MLMQKGRPFMQEKEDALTPSCSRTVTTPRYVHWLQIQLGGGDGCVQLPS